MNNTKIVLDKFVSLINDGWEFPDAEYKCMKIALQLGVKWSDVLKAYDEQE